MPWDTFVAIYSFRDLSTPSTYWAQIFLYQDEKMWEVYLPQINLSQHWKYLCHLCCVNAETTSIWASVTQGKEVPNNPNANTNAFEIHKLAEQSRFSKVLCKNRVFWETIFHIHEIHKRNNVNTQWNWTLCFRARRLTLRQGFGYIALAWWLLKREPKTPFKIDIYTRLQPCFFFFLENPRVFPLGGTGTGGVAQGLNFECCGDWKTR